MLSYSLWEQGRDGMSGQIASMIPVQLASSDMPSPVGSLSVPGQALSAVAEFGIYYELHQMRRLQQAQFEERRLGWLDAILNQWIDEHREHCGVRSEVTGRVQAELAKLVEKLCENPAMDVPQVLLAKLDRVTDFLESQFRLHAQVLNLLVDSSRSDPAWGIADDLNFSEMVREHLHEEIRRAEGQLGKSIWQAALSAPLFLIPFVGPLLGGGGVGFGVGGAHAGHTLKRALERLLTMPEVSRLEFVNAALELSQRHLTGFLTQQRWRIPRTLVLTSRENSLDVQIIPTLHANVTPAKRPTKVRLKSLPAPDS